MDLSLLIYENLDNILTLIPIIFSSIVFVAINNNLNKIEIPKTENEFNNEYNYEHKINSILINNLENYSIILQKIIVNTIKSNISEKKTLLI